MVKLVDKACKCYLLEDDELEAGFTCYNCYEFRKEGSNG
jgi:hypothetical protein